MKKEWKNYKSRINIDRTFSFSLFVLKMRKSIVFWISFFNLSWKRNGTWSTRIDNISKIILLIEKSDLDILSQNISKSFDQNPFSALTENYFWLATENYSYYIIGNILCKCMTGLNFKQFQKFKLWMSSVM